MTPMTNIVAPASSARLQRIQKALSFDPAYRACRPVPGPRSGSRALPPSRHPPEHVELSISSRLMDAARPQLTPKVTAPPMTSPRRGRCSVTSCGGGTRRVLLVLRIRLVRLLRIRLVSRRRILPVIRRGYGRRCWRSRGGGRRVRRRSRRGRRGWRTRLGRGGRGRGERRTKRRVAEEREHAESNPLPEGARHATSVD